MWKALLVDGQTRVACSTAKCTGGASEGIDWVLGPATSYLRADGKPLLTTNDAGIVLVYPIANDAAGNRINFWTGLDTDWTANANRNCNGWTSETPRIKGRAGWDQDQAQTWIQSMDIDCSMALSFGCVEQ